MYTIIYVSEQHDSLIETTSLLPSICERIGIEVIVVVVPTQKRDKFGAKGRYRALWYPAFAPCSKALTSRMYDPHTITVKACVLLSVFSSANISSVEEADAGQATCNNTDQGP